MKNKPDSMKCLLRLKIEDLDGVEALGNQQFTVRKLILKYREGHRKQ